MKKIALFSVMLLLIGVSVFAQPLPSYGVAKLGGYMPEANDVKDFDTAFYGEIAVGYHFHKNFAGLFGVGYTKSSADRNNFNADLTVIPMTVALKGGLPMGVFEPYALVGIGAYYVEAKGSNSFGSFNTDDTAFGYSQEENDISHGSSHNDHGRLGREGIYRLSNRSKPSCEGDSRGGDRAPEWGSSLD